MSDGKVKRYALIINGDTETSHIENVEKSLRVLGRDGYETFVASTSKPKERHDHYSKAALIDVRGIADEIARKADDDDEIVIYTTGHGASDNGTAKLCVEDGCNYEKIAAILDIKKYGQRTVIMDQCYGGNWSKLFLDDPKTLFVSAGSKDEKTCCNEFAPHFWAGDIQDLNGDGIISWQERYATATKKGGNGSFTQFVASAGYMQAGKPPFAPEVREVQNESNLSEELKKLKPGQYAILFFSADWCVYCGKYEPQYKEMAKEDKGQHLFLMTKDLSIASKYDVYSLPTIMVISSEGAKYTVTDKSKLLDEISQFNMPIEQRLSILRGRLNDSNSKIRWATIDVYLRLSEKPSSKEAAEGAKALREFFGDKDPDVRERAVYVYGYLAGKLSPDGAAEEAEALRKLFGDKKDPDVRESAVTGYEYLAGKLSADGAAKEAEALRKLFGNENSYVRKSAGYAYGNLADKLSPDEAAEGAKALRKLFDDKDSDVRVNAFIGYGCLADKLSPDEAAEGAKALRKLFDDKDSDVRVRAVYGYGYLAGKLSPDEAAEGAKVLRELFGDKDPDVRASAVYGYHMLRGKLSPDGAAEGAKALRELFDDKDSDIRAMAVRAYEMLVKYQRNQ